MRLRNATLWILATTTYMSSAFAFPLRQGDDGFALRPQFNLSNQFLNFNSDGVDFSGTVALDNCSGSLVRFKHSKPTDKGIILTNGHCLQDGFMSAGEVRTNEEVNRGFKLLSPDGRQNLATLNSRKLLYATMTHTDMALYELSKTYEEIRERTGIQPLLIRDDRAPTGTKIAIPSGYWRRGYSCKVDTYVHSLREGDWTFLNSLRYLQPGCEIIGGTSGSPVIDAETREVIAVNNTMNDEGLECEINNPCEVSEDGSVSFKKGRGYAQHTYWIYSCLTEENKIDLDREGCRLPK